MSWLAPNTLQRFGSITKTQFLRDYWQKKPLFIKKAVPELASLLDGDDLAGLALEAHVESRIVRQHAAGRWELQRGPFTEEHFQSLPKNNWTLLVQAVDQFLPELADLLDRFNFLPHWRIDDVMVSYAVDGGSVGPHIDSYDVFLIQGQGTRRWQLGLPSPNPTWLSHPDLRILADMNVSEEFLCEPGDLLYLPPQFPHWGTAQGSNCMTWSVGFRAPGDRELLEGFCSHLIEQIPEQQRYSDPGIKSSPHPGVLSTATIKTLRTRLNTLFEEPGALEDFLGSTLSAPKYLEHAPDVPEPLWTLQALKQALAQTDTIRRDEGSRFLLLPAQFAPALFVDGERIPLAVDGEPLQAAAFIADHRLINALPMRQWLNDEHAAILILRLFNSGHLYLPE